MKKILFIFPALFFFFVLLISALSPYVEMSEDISKKVFRLHILANSNEDYDQELKLMVRDEILLLSKDIFESCNSVQEAVDIANENIENIISAANKVIAENGYNYCIKACVTKEYFKTRKYNSFSLPAGIYASLKIEIGQGKGKNWWCVMFPSVCISGCTSDLEGTLSCDEIEMIENDKYIIRFKAVELYERIKNSL